MISLILLGGFDDALKVFRPFCPSKGIGVHVVILKVPVKKGFQLGLGSLNALAKTLFGEDAEEAFDQIEP